MSRLHLKRINKMGVIWGHGGQAVKRGISKFWGLFQEFRTFWGSIQTFAVVLI